jgi:hypothetical protein
VKPTYVPILRAKQGEFEALTQLSVSARQRVLPLLDLPKPKGGKTLDQHLFKLVADIASACTGQEILLDTFAWLPSATTAKGEYILPYVRARLEQEGVEVNPVVGYDRWDDADYKQACASIDLPTGRVFCLRLDRDAIDDVSDPEYFAEKIADILAHLGCGANECFVLIDLDDVSHQAVVDLLPLVTTGISGLMSLGFVKIVLAGSSIPPSISEAVEKVDSVGYVSRREMLVWQTLVTEFPNVVYGDYGVRSPRAQEDVIAPHTNAKIRYTTDKRCFIARGHSLQLAPKGEQNYALARKIIDSPHFVGANFSWGDSRIVACANREFKGNSTQWIAIDTNHHIEATVAEVIDFLGHIKVREISAAA